MSTASITIVSEDYTHGRGYWAFAGVYRAGRGDAILRVEIRADAYERQSYAKVSQWGVGGWQFHTSLPTEDWYEQTPSYVKRELTSDDHYTFEWIRHELLARYVAAVRGPETGIVFAEKVST